MQEEPRVKVWIADDVKEGVYVKCYVEALSLASGNATRNSTQEDHGVQSKMYDNISLTNKQVTK